LIFSLFKISSKWFTRFLFNFSSFYFS